MTASGQQRPPNGNSMLRSGVLGLSLLCAACLMVGVTVVTVNRLTVVQLPEAQATFSSWCITPLGGGMVSLPERAWPCHRVRINI